MKQKSASRHFSAKNVRSWKSFGDKVDFENKENNQIPWKKRVIWNLSQLYKRLCFSNYTFPNQQLLNSLKYSEIVISLDSILKQSESKDLTPIQLAFDHFNDISLISLYSDVISAEDLDMLNNRELTSEEWRDLKRTITTI